MNLEDLAASDTITVELVHPTHGQVTDDNGKPMTVTLLGSHTDEHKKMERKIGFKQAKENIKSSKVKPENRSLAEFEKAIAGNSEVDLEVLTASIKDCYIVFGGRAIDATKKDLLPILSDQKFSWITAQLFKEKANQELFYQS